MPAIESPGAADGLVQVPAEKVLPAGYTLAHDLQTPEPPAPPVQPDPPVRPNPPIVPPVAPMPAATDPVSWLTVRTALRKQPTRVTIARNGSRVTFRETLLEPGRISYRLSIRVRSGKKLRTHTIGQARYIRSRAGAFTVRINVTKNGRALLRKHPRTAVNLRSSFVTPVEKRTINTNRTLKRR